MMRYIYSLFMVAVATITIGCGQADSTPSAENADVEEVTDATADAIDDAGEDIENLNEDSADKVHDIVDSVTDSVDDVSDEVGDAVDEQN